MVRTAFILPFRRRVEAVSETVGNVGAEENVGEVGLRTILRWSENPTAMRWIAS
jgi:hypothetical protein